MDEEEENKIQDNQQQIYKNIDSIKNNSKMAEDVIFSENSIKSNSNNKRNRG